MLEVPGPQDKEFDQPTVHQVVEPKVRFSYSLDGRSFVDLGDAFVADQGRWTGAQIGLFATAPYGTPAAVATSVGHADYESFILGR